MQALNDFGSLESGAGAINAKGQVVGYIELSGHYHPVSDKDTASELPLLGGNDGGVNSINDNAAGR